MKLCAEAGNQMIEEKTKLILGSAGKRHPDAITLDIDSKHKPDVIHDLNKIPWPFRDNQFKSIICHHILEHLNDIRLALEELHRICSNEGEIYIEVPHRTSWCADSPYHKLKFNYFSLDCYLQGGRTGWVITDKKFKAIEKRITFHRVFRRYFLHKIFNRFPDYYERFWAYIIPAENLIFRLQPVK